MATPSGLRQHYLSVHNATNTGSALGQRCPLCEEYTRKDDVLTRHAAVHGLQTADRLMRKAADEGDPHGVVKAARELLTRA